MKISVVLDAQGKIATYAIVGGIEGGQTIHIPDDTDLSIFNHAKWDGEKLVELPIEDPLEPGPSKLDQLREQVTAQQEILDILIGVAK